MKCNIPPKGWSCTRVAGHDGPCAAIRKGTMLKFVCWFSKHFWDIHDEETECRLTYDVNHGYTYICWNCGKRFTL